MKTSLSSPVQGSDIPSPSTSPERCRQLENQITELAAYVERVVRGFRQVQRIEALQRENQRHALRSLEWHADDSGCLLVRGRFTPEQGAVLVKALERVMEQEWKEQQNVSAETPVDEFQPRSEPIAQRRADALVRMARSCRATSAGGDAFLVHVHTDRETLRSDGAGTEAELETGGHVSAETSPRSRSPTRVTEASQSI